MADTLFNSFFIGGFEASTHVLRSGKRLDMLEATGHTRHIRRDYQRLMDMGINTARTGIRWHLIEQRAGVYDWSSALPMIRSARETGMQLIWDLLHYGYPNDIDLFSTAFLRRFRKLARAFAHMLAQETDYAPYICPVNEISFFAWAGGDGAHMNPFANGRSFELKCQLVRAALEATDVMWEVFSDARICHVDPVLHIVPNPDRPYEIADADGYRIAQYQGWDLLGGILKPEVGGEARHLDVLGLNFYPNNEWVYKGDTLKRHDPRYKPFREIIREVYSRYQRPMFIAETGAEGDQRVEWLRYMCSEVRAAIDEGLPVHGICLYPIMNFPGWEDDRDCQNGLWEYPDANGNRQPYHPLAQELIRQQAMFEPILQVQNFSQFS